VKETWDTAEFRELLEKKFFFVFFQYEGRSLILRKAKFWNMPYSDREEAKKVWHRTIDVVLAGNIVSAITNGIRSTNFPKSTENCVAHVRPHARNAADTCDLPVADELTGSREYTKHSFWLNDKYVKNQIFGK
jgi:hypothetical protein